MAKLIRTDESLAWLRSIGDYLAQQNPNAAATVTEGIYNKAQLLKNHPQLGYRMTDIEDREVRVILYGHYRIVYELRQTNVAYVLAIIHSAMDIDRLEF